MKNITRQFSPRRLRTWLRRSVATGLVACSSALALAQTFDWDTVRIGGGGFVTGIVCHPLEQNLVYHRTDVGGVYRWSPAPDAKGRNWIPLHDHISWENRPAYCIDGIALDPNNKERIWIAAGDNNNNTGPFADDSGVYRSSDRGDTWVKANLPKQFYANTSGRSNGERIAVDPANGDIVICGTRLEGLWKTTNAWAATPTWTQLVNLPTTVNVNAVAFDPATASGGATQRVYASTYEGSVYRSNDAGANWTNISGTAIKPRRIAVAGDGKLWVTTDGFNVRRYDPVANTWTTFVINTSDAGSYSALAVDPRDSQHVVVGEGASSFGNRFYRTTNGGGAWTQFVAGGANVSVQTSAPWWPTGRFGSAISAFAFDSTFNDGAGTRSKKLWMGDWYHAWYTNDAGALPQAWTNQEAGREEGVNLVLAALPANSSGTLLVSGFADIGGFRHTDFAAAPSSTFGIQSNGKLIETTGIAYCRAQPASIVIAGSDTWGGTSGALYVSSDGGQSITQRTSYLATWGMARVAVASNNSNKIVALTKAGGVRYSTDGGVTWLTSASAPTGSYGMGGNAFHRNHALCADANQADTFYIYTAGTSTTNRVFKSTDGGANWTVYAANGLPSLSDTNLSSAAYGIFTIPGSSGDTWLNDVWAWTSDTADGIYRSQNGGVTFSKITTISQVQGFAAGAKYSGASYPALYAFGLVGSDTERWLYRSDDAGATWTRINTDDPRLGTLTYLAASPDVAGRVFVGTNGRGIFIGEDPNLSGLQPFTVANGQVVMETDNYDANTAGSPHQWTAVTTPSGYIGANALQATPNNGTANLTTLANPVLDYDINFPAAGTYYVYVRGQAATTGDNSIHVGLNGVGSTTTTGGLTGFTSAYTWQRNNGSAAPVTVTVPSAGVHTFNVWMREDGCVIDRIILSTNASLYANGATANGPAESPRGTPPAQSLTINPADDAHVNSLSASTNYDTATSMEVKLPSDSTATRVAYFKFSLAGVGTISSATLKVSGRLNSAGSASVGAYAVSDISWTEGAINWSNRPTPGSNALATVTVNSTTATVFSFDVTAQVQAAKTAGAASVSFALQNTAATANISLWGSDESSPRPELVVAP